MNQFGQDQKYLRLNNFTQRCVLPPNCFYYFLEVFLGFSFLFTLDGYEKTSVCVQADMLA